MRPKPKPQAHEEVARVLHVFSMLDEELFKRLAPDAYSNEAIKPPSGDAILAVAERIAARTEG